MNYVDNQHSFKKAKYHAFIPSLTHLLAVVIFRSIGGRETRREFGSLYVGNSGINKF